MAIQAYNAVKDMVHKLYKEINLMISVGGHVKYPIAFQVLKDRKKELVHVLIQKRERISNLYKQLGVDVPKELRGSEVYLNL